jgi:hypothetical protein
LKLTNGVVSTTVYFQQDPSGTQAPSLTAFGKDPTLPVWIDTKEAKFLNDIGPSFDAGAFTKLPADAMNEYPTLNKSGFKIATIPSSAS